MDNSLFAGNAFTVVNFWFNGCKPCVEELDDLNALNEKVKAQGGEVIGINTETLDGNQQGIDAAKKLLETTGASYRNIYFASGSEAGKFALNIMAFPTTYVFDRDGNVVGQPLLGGIDKEENLAALQKNIDAALAKDNANVQRMTNESAGENAYTIFDTDEHLDSSTIEALKQIPSMYRVRVIK